MLKFFLLKKRVHCGILELWVYLIPKLYYAQFSFMLAKHFVYMEAQNNDHYTYAENGSKIIKVDLELFTIPIKWSYPSRCGFPA